MYDIIVVGSGFSGSILARKLAEEKNKKVLVVEKRNHIAGNMYDEFDRGILLQKYGPHYLHSNNYQVIKFLEQYGELKIHIPEGSTFVNNKYYKQPYNFTTIQEIFGLKDFEDLLKILRRELGEGVRIPIANLISHSSNTVSFIGDTFFNLFFKGYLTKMWNTSIDKIDKTILERVPITIGYDNRMINKDFQLIPKKGFTKLFNNMLNHPNITIQLETDALKYISFENEKIKYLEKDIELLIYTGPIDELFSEKYGKLPYRSLNFSYEYFSKDSLPTEIVVYPEEDKTYIRKTKYSKENSIENIVATEYPLDYIKNSCCGNIPYYPVRQEDSLIQLELYQKLAQQYDNLILCGRLAEFKYIDMDTTIENALAIYSKRKYFIRRNE